MNETRKIPISLPFSILMAIVQTIISILPGLLLLENKDGTTIATFSFIAYLFISEIFQYLIRLANKNGVFVNPLFYIGKLALSSFLIFSIANATILQYAIILFSYEVFQFLCYSRKFSYMNSFLYLILNSFFKGIVLNQLLIINYPFTFNLDRMQVFIFSFLIMLLYTTLLQGFYSNSQKSPYYLWVSFFFIILLYGFLFYAFKTKQIDLYRIILITASNIFFLIHFFKTTNPKKKEFALSLFILVALLFYYY